MLKHWICTLGAVLVATTVIAQMPPNMVRQIRTVSAKRYTQAPVTLVQPAGYLVAWGETNLGTPCPIPWPAEGSNDVVDVSGAGYYIMVKHTDGSLHAWGDNASGWTNIPPGLQGHLTKWDTGNAGYAMVALRDDGAVIGWGWDNYSVTSGIPAVLSSGAKDVTKGTWNSGALSMSNSPVLWGRNYAGETVSQPTWTDCVAIACGGVQTLAIRASLNYGVAVLGNNSYGQLTVPASAQSNVTAVSSGDHHCMALLSNRTVVCWGDNAYGQSSTPAGLTNVIQIYAAQNNSYALTGAGEVIGWGPNGKGQTNTPAAAKSGIIKVVASGGSAADTCTVMAIKRNN